jgi:hypothetical protein
VRSNALAGSRLLIIAVRAPWIEPFTLCNVKKKFRRTSCEAACVLPVFTDLHVMYSNGDAGVPGCCTVLSDTKFRTLHAPLTLLIPAEWSANILRNFGNCLPNDAP